MYISTIVVVYRYSSIYYVIQVVVVAQKGFSTVFLHQLMVNYSCDYLINSAITFSVVSDKTLCILFIEIDAKKWDWGKKFHICSEFPEISKQSWSNLLDSPYGSFSQVMEQFFWPFQD